MYAEVSVIVDGALEDEGIFFDEAMMRWFILDAETSAESHGYRTEVFVVEHDHDPTDECSCVQYLTDHHPYAIFNAEAE